MFRFKWERNNAISLVTIRMELVIPISHSNLRIANYRGKYRGTLSPGIFDSWALLVAAARY